MLSVQTSAQKLLSVRSQLALNCACRHALSFEQALLDRIRQTTVTGSKT